MTVEDWFACMKCGHALDTTINYCPTCKTEYALELINLRREIRSACDTHYIRVTMEDNTEWDIPVCVIAWQRALQYSQSPGVDIVDVYRATMRIFETSHSTIVQWARNGVRWVNIAEYSIKYVEKQDIDWQRGLQTGNVALIRKTLSNDSVDDSERLEIWNAGKDTRVEP